MTLIINRCYFLRMEQPVNNTIKQLLQAIANDDKKAFRCFYDRFYPVIYRFARYFMPYGTACDEVVSEVFCIIWYNRKTIVDIKNIEAYLYTICRNEAWRLLKLEEKYQNISIDEIPVELFVYTESIENELYEEEMFELFKISVNRLPERCKLIFLMSREEKLRNKEIAEILNITEGTVEQQINIAIKKIVGFVKQYYPIFNHKPIARVRKLAD